MPRVISIASGKGGVGKTSFAINLACELSKTQRVCLIDADLGLANVDIILGIDPIFTLEHVIFHNIPLSQALVSFQSNLDILPGGSGVTGLANLTIQEKNKFISQLTDLYAYDYILIDNSPGIIPQVLSFCLASRELILVITPEATSITDGYALLKSLKENGLQFPPFIVLNRIRTKNVAQKIFNKISAAAKQFLKLNVLFLGAIPEEKLMSLEMQRHQPFIHIFPQAPAGKCFKLVAERLHARPKRDLFTITPKDFWEKALVQYAHRAGTQVPSRGNDQGEKNNFGNQTDELFSRLLHQLEEVLKLSPRSWEQLAQKNSHLPRLKEKILQLEQLVDSHLQGVKQLPSMAQKRNVICYISADQDMKKILHDLISQTGYQPLDLLTDQASLKNILLIIYCLERNFWLPQQFLRSYSNTPTILLTGFGSNIPLSFLTQQFNIVKIVKPPFHIQDIFQAIETFTHNDLSDNHFLQPTA